MCDGEQNVIHYVEEKNNTKYQNYIWEVGGDCWNIHSFIQS